MGDPRGPAGLTLEFPESKQGLSLSEAPVLSAQGPTALSTALGQARGNTF